MHGVVMFEKSGLSHDQEMAVAADVVPVFLHLLEDHVGGARKHEAGFDGTIDGADEATNDAVPPMLAPTNANRLMPCVFRYATAPSTSCQMAPVAFSPLEHPASPPGQWSACRRKGLFGHQIS